MPAVRLSRRRKSSLAHGLTAKAGVYRSSPLSPRSVTFAPNVTPISYSESDPELSLDSTGYATLFPPSETPAPPPTRRRVPPGKRRSLGYIPRPPNAFMLFRADFVRQKHVPGSIEANHGSLSKIIGNCWRSLPLEEKKVWEFRAKSAKAAHKLQYPEYRFRPVHNKNKAEKEDLKKKKEKLPVAPVDERRCEEVAQLLLEGKKGDELAAAVRHLDSTRQRPSTPPLLRHSTSPHHHRRSSSVPLPNDFYSANNITLPSVNFSRPGSPGMEMSMSQRMMYGSRRASSARPAQDFRRSWTMPCPLTLQRDESPLPEVDTSLFEQSFLDAGSNFFPSNSMFSMTETMIDHQRPHIHALGPLDVTPRDPFSPYSSSSPSTADSSQNWSSPASSYQFDAPTPSHFESQPSPFESAPSSHASSAYSGSPALSNSSLPMHHLTLDIVAPQPVHPDMNLNSETVFTDLWKGLTANRSFTIASDSDSTMPFTPESHSGLAFDDGSYGQQYGQTETDMDMSKYTNEFDHMNLGYDAYSTPEYEFAQTPR
ncbi:hypothetical protein C8J56DRAFT_916681 [Mycena floridula]|nr:hypothetical protein C8J56DRAFT_916681 [Mycena floridula]